MERVRVTKTAVPHRLGDLQLSILQVLWDQAEASVTGVLEGLGPGHGLAYTTVATMLRRMEERGLVAHRAEGRSFVYRAVVAAETVSRGMAGHWLDRLFGGSLTEAVQHLLTTRQVSRTELKAIRQLVNEKLKRP